MATSIIIFDLICVFIGFLIGVFSIYFYRKVGRQYLLNYKKYKYSTNDTNFTSFVVRQYLFNYNWAENWSIGIYTGNNVFNIEPIGKNPILTANDVKDVKAVFVADPFMVKEKDTWFMFFEVFNANTNMGEIGYAKSYDGINWQYQRIIIKEPFHLSYPYVFKYNNDYYLIPETHEINSINIYKADEFPLRWSIYKVLIKGHYEDSSIIFYKEKWWLFAGLRSSQLHLFYSEDLLGPWSKHSQNPVIKNNPHKARPSGRMILLDGKLIRFSQDDSPHYGLNVQAFEITELSTTSFKERPAIAKPILKPSGSGWNAKGMHHIDPHRIGENHWIACVDGWSELILDYAVRKHGN